ncbi:Hsp20/alpha crystallin family protein [Candidatus Tisiphia endosymbiont of Nemotelus uliginosus]|uniref:Hsp20/alpha crystallin family protein n=1 Tax=Candidatus Tisiphia endosymbiont of Nemotelus uliginosus TaxID=3077926 RepID=UPI0035C91BE1
MENYWKNFDIYKNKQEVRSTSNTKLGISGVQSSTNLFYISNLLILSIVIATLMVFNNLAEAATVKTPQTKETVKGQQDESANQRNETYEYYNPFEQLSKNMDRLWHKIAIRDNSGYIVDGSFMHSTSFNSYLDSNDKEHILNIEIPGFEKEQVKVELQGEYIIIKAQKAEENKKDNSPTNSQFRNSFYQKLLLPKDVNKNAIATTLKNGVLTIILPKSPIKTEEIKTIPIG